MKERFLKWCASNTTSAKVTRTIAQGVVSLLVAWLPTWAGANLPPAVTASIIPACMAILAALQSWLGKTGTYMDGDADVSD